MTPRHNRRATASVVSADVQSVVFRPSRSPNAAGCWSAPPRKNESAARYTHKVAWELPVNPRYAARGHFYAVGATTMRRAAVGLLAALVFEGHTKLRAEGDGATVAQIEILLDDLGDSQVSEALA